jgi:response regulator of citrate/malate metabolism
MHAPNLCTIGQPAPDAFEVVWNGAIERQHSAQHTLSAPRVIERSPYQRILLWNRTRVHSESAAKMDRGSTRLCDRLLVYLVDHASAVHTGTSVALAFNITLADASSYLRRHTRRGLLRRETTYGPRGRQLATFHVVEEAR